MVYIGFEKEVLDRLQRIEAKVDFLTIKKQVDRQSKEKASKDALSEGYKKGKKDTEDALNVVSGDDAKRFYEATGLKPEDSL